MELVPSPLPAHLSLPRTVLSYNYDILQPFFEHSKGPRRNLPIEEVMRSIESDRDSKSFSKRLTDFSKNIDE